MALKSQNKAVGTIFTELRPNLMLLDHWTLYDSLCNSNFMISHFRLWSEEGRRNLLTFLVNWGVKIQQAKQIFSCMESDVKRKLRENLMDVFKKNKLEGNVQPCFVKQIQISKQIHSFDQAYALTSILQCPLRLSEIDSETDVAAMVANLSGESKEEDDFETMLNQQKDNFWLSYRALD